jgi:hypothetical protein
MKSSKITFRWSAMHVVNQHALLTIYVFIQNYELWNLNSTSLKKLREENRMLINKLRLKLNKVMLFYSLTWYEMYKFILMVWAEWRNFFL